MQNHNDIDLYQLTIEGKNFKWNKPKCPKCFGAVWGHGFIASFFEGFKNPIFLKRYRCNNSACHAVITMRPNGFWKKFQFSIQCIFNALSERLGNLFWPIDVPRQRGGHWLRKFIKKIKMDYGLENGGISLLERLRLMRDKSIHFFY